MEEEETKKPNTVTTGFSPTKKKQTQSAPKAPSAENTQTAGFTRSAPTKITNAELEMKRLQEDIRDSSNW